MNKEEKAITLIALVITIIVLLILAGVTLNIALGENGILAGAKTSAQKTQRAQIQEELELTIADARIKKAEAGGTLTTQDIKDALEKLPGLEISSTVGNVIEGEYKDYGFVVEDTKVTVSEKPLTGEKPTGEVKNLTQEESGEPAETVLLQVIGRVENGTIQKIEPIETENITFEEADERNSDNSKIYRVSDNGTYNFKITASNGRICIATTKVTNVIVAKKDILTGIEDITNSGNTVIKVKGKTEDAEETILYGMNVAYYKGNLILGDAAYSNAEKTEESKVTVENLNLSGTTWSVGVADAVNTKGVVLKVDGDLTLETGYTLTSIKSGTATGKGLYIYCTGVLTIDGAVNMNGVSCSAPRENVYLWQNMDKSFAYVQATGGNGGAGRANGSACATGVISSGGGGGGSGYSNSYSGAQGSSYVGR